MLVTVETVLRPSNEGSLVGLAGIVLRSGKALVTVNRPSRAYFRNDGKVTVRSYSTGTTVTLNSFEPVVAWNENGAVPITVHDTTKPAPVFVWDNEVNDPRAFQRWEDNGVVMVRIADMDPFESQMTPGDFQTHVTEGRLIQK